MTTVPASPAPPAPLNIPKQSRRRRLRLPRLLACLAIGLVFTTVLSVATAVWLPFVRPYTPMFGGGDGPVEYVQAFIQNAETRREALTRWTSDNERVEVATWGDHLQPWHIRITTPFASRLTWFEKGRVYNRSDVKAPAAASSAAVSCWSFATACWAATGNKLTGPLPVPPELTQSNQERRTWATAIEKRGWPFRAFTCRFSAPMGSTDGPVYTVEGGFSPALDDASARGLGMMALGGEIQTVRAIPTTPLWSGLLADTLLFAAVFYTLSLLPSAAIRRIRIKRSRCPDCNYNLSGQSTPGCPECGWNRPQS